MKSRSRIIPERVSNAIPNAITGLAILAGYCALVSVLKQDYIQAAWLIVFAALLDFLDGYIARLINATSEFGVQFDSLADIVNYGVVPAMLYYAVYFDQWGILGVLLSFSLVLSAAVRLARFNARLDQDGPGSKDTFVGLPTTMSAFLLSGYLIFTGEMASNYGHPGLSVLILVMVAFLMVSNVPYDKDNIQAFRITNRFQRLLLGAIILASLVFIPSVAVFVLGLLYVMWAPMSSIALSVKGRL